MTEEPDAATEPETEQPVEEASAEVVQPVPEAEPQPVEGRRSPWDTYEEEEEPGKKKKNKKRRKRKKFWARRREKEAERGFNEAEDMYYGIQLKPIDEYTRGFDATGEISTQDEGYRNCLTRTPRSLTTKWQRDLERLQKERRRRG